MFVPGVRCVAQGWGMSLACLRLASTSRVRDRDGEPLCFSVKPLWYCCCFSTAPGLRESLDSTPARAKLGRVGECIRERHHRVNKVVRAKESYSWGQGLMQMELLGQAEQSKQNKLGVGRPGGLGPPLRSLSASSLGLALPFLGAGPEIPRDLPLNC